MDPHDEQPNGDAEHAPKTDTEWLRLLLDALRRRQTAEPDDLP
ncbi:hypothetical protein [Streptomyces sp. IB2014 016-6]|nr:hypothetical protein [Streptomyces sp. IB2014 016-6]